MHTHDLPALLRQVASGALDPQAAAALLTADGEARLGFATLDHERPHRCGFPEVIFGAGKTTAQIHAIVADFAARGRPVLVTRLGAEAAAELVRAYPAATYDALGRTLLWLPTPVPVRPGTVAIITAGTSDLPVAHEAAATLALLGVTHQLIADVGVAGIHRLLRRVDELRAHRVLIVVAGMEGALPSVVGGLVPTPVIAVPTSVGYGASFGGLAALLGMLNTCAAGVLVTNIDNGFGAACAAARILGPAAE